MCKNVVSAAGYLPYLGIISNRRHNTLRSPPPALVPRTYHYVRWTPITYPGFATSATQVCVPGQEV